MNATRRRFITQTVAMSVVGCSDALAQQPQYPTHPVKIIVPLPAGSGPDLRHRLIGQYLGQLWGQQTIVENRPGGGGLIATRAALAGSPDGYTLLVGLASVYTILPAQNEKLPFDVNSDLIPIGLTSNEGMVIAASPKLGINSLLELIEVAKKKPDELIIGTNPAGSLPHLAAKLFVDVSGAPMRVVPYSTGGTNDAIRDIMGGRVHAVIDGVIALKSGIEAGSLQPLAIMSHEPLRTLPSVPVASNIIPGLTALGWQSLVAPKGTPEPVVRKLTEDLQTVLANPELQRRLLETGSPFQPRSGAALRRFIDDEEKLWWPLVKKYGAT
jgi:tripartite-type tricarboxylate transporter receptor subunit TctC